MATVVHKKNTLCKMRSLKVLIVLEVIVNTFISCSSHRTTFYSARQLVFLEALSSVMFKLNEFGIKIQGPFNADFVAIKNEMVLVQ